MDPCISLDGTKSNSLCAESEADYRKVKKKMQETDTGGLQVYTTPAVSVFLIVFLHYSIVGSKATSQQKQFAEIYSKTSVPIQ